jgi:hypothetical protein
VHRPSTHREPLLAQSPSALHEVPNVEPSEASTLVAESPVAESPELASPVLASLGLALSTPASPGLLYGTHWATPFDSLHTCPLGHPVVLQSAVVSSAASGGVYEVPG